MSAQIGVMGVNAANAFKQVPAERKHSTTIDYLKPETQGEQRIRANSRDALFALFRYAQEFQPDPDSFTHQFTHQEIVDATGLRVPETANLENAWNLDNQNGVDLSEMAAGLSTLDKADGRLDGRITQKGRENVEGFFYTEEQPIPDTAREKFPDAAAFLDGLRSLRTGPAAEARQAFLRGLEEYRRTPVDVIQPPAGQVPPPNFQREVVAPNWEGPGGDEALQGLKQVYIQREGMPTSEEFAANIDRLQEEGEELVSLNASTKERDLAHKQESYQIIVRQAHEAGNIPNQLEAYRTRRLDSSA